MIEDKNICAIYDFLKEMQHLTSTVSSLQKELDDLYNSLCFMKERSDIFASEIQEYEVKRILAEPDKPCYVYYMLNRERDRVKIGISDNVEMRAKQLQNACGDVIEVLNFFKCPDRKEAFEIESFLHNEFSYWRIKGLKVSKSVEWFDAKIIPNLQKYCNTYERTKEYMAVQRKLIKDDMNKMKPII